VKSLIRIKKSGTRFLRNEELKDAQKQRAIILTSQQRGQKKRVEELRGRCGAICGGKKGYLG